MAEPTSRPDIFDFQNHRPYMNAMFRFKKATHKSFSYTYCARKMGVSSGYLKNLFTRRRSLSLDVVTRFAHTFGLSSVERRYLTVLIVYDELKDLETKHYFDGVLATLRARAKEFQENNFFSSTSSEEKILKDGLLHLLLSLIKLEGFSPTPQWVKSTISQGFKFSDKQIENGFHHLLDKKFVALEDGQYRVINECLSSPDPYDPESFKIYRTGLRQIDNALEEIERYKSCNFFMANLTIDNELEREALDIFTRCRDELLALEKRSRSPKKVIAISNNFVTLAKV